MMYAFRQAMGLFQLTFAPDILGRSNQNPTGQILVGHDKNFVSDTINGATVNYDEVFGRDDTTFIPEPKVV